MFNRIFGGGQQQVDLDQVIKNGGKVIDVRSPAEFAQGHAPGSINIPLDQIPHRVDELKNMKAPLVLCCASGGRSGSAMQFLHNHDIEAYNAGPWHRVPC